ncbi:hypothetical protein NSK_006470 [Nannochloropsis salina CCMP1776]|uniref:Uncharacterized protein n=1 Tax=Nannochloropsis salina CCMP1776 TaxID=1027361 RepID=A0A4D9CSD8_9STRA|nr:hypothetical protein NSK_006470 [Nannochloropsis salina CCMP1776]|eukprot:TFJ82141.1 hypothetical protein NSK_006470 [Nannochloropsis salina CCMP1776]
MEDRTGKTKNISLSTMTFAEAHSSKRNENTTITMRRQFCGEDVNDAAYYNEQIETDCKSLEENAKRLGAVNWDQVQCGDAANEGRDENLTNSRNQNPIGTQIKIETVSSLVPGENLEGSSTSQVGHSLPAHQMPASSQKCTSISSRGNKAGIHTMRLPSSAPLPELTRQEHVSSGPEISPDIDRSQSRSNGDLSPPLPHSTLTDPTEAMPMTHLSPTTVESPPKREPALSVSSRPPSSNQESSSSQSHGVITALMATLRAHTIGNDLPDALLTTHCQGLVRMLRETAALNRFILGESALLGDSQAYMDVCAHHVQRHATRQLGSLRILREDFHEKHAALQKELRGLREQVSSLRARVLQAAWPEEKKTVILAALQRYLHVDQPGGELQTLDLTESAIGAVQKLRRQLPRLPEEADALREVFGKIKRVTRTLVALGLTTEEQTSSAWESVVQLLTYRPMGFVLEEADRAWRELKDVKLQEAQRRLEQKGRLTALLERAGSPPMEETGMQQESGITGALEMEGGRRNSVESCMSDRSLGRSSWGSQSRRSSSSSSSGTAVEREAVMEEDDREGPRDSSETSHTQTPPAGSNMTAPWASASSRKSSRSRVLRNGPSPTSSPSSPSTAPLFPRSTTRPPARASMYVVGTSASAMLGGAPVLTNPQGGAGGGRGRGPRASPGAGKSAGTVTAAAVPARRTATPPSTTTGRGGNAGSGSKLHVRGAPGDDACLGIPVTEALSGRHEGLSSGVDAGNSNTPHEGTITAGNQPGKASSISRSTCSSRSKAMSHISASPDTKGGQQLP